MPETLEDLEAQYPNWTFGKHWVAVASGPDFFCYWGLKNGARITERLTAQTIEDLAADVRRTLTRM